MSEEEYATYQVTHKQQEEERRKREEEKALLEALHRSERAEQRAIEAERAAREAQAKAAAAEEAARNRPPIYPLPTPTLPPTSSRIMNCDRAGCWDDRGTRYHQGNGNVMISPSGPCRQIGGMIQCP